MLIESIARRYAKAIFDAAAAQKAADTVKLELLEFARAVERNIRLRSLWESRLASPETKKAMLKKGMPEVSTLTLRFLFVLIGKRREKLLEECVREYEKLLLEFYNQTTVDVQSAAPLPGTVQDELKARLSKMLGKNVSLILSENPALLGGMIVQVGDKVLDGSLRTKLETLREMLIATPLPA